MKLISLNIWGGKAFEPLLEFIGAHRDSTDIFCFQEVFKSSSNVRVNRGVRTNILDDFSRTLSDFCSYFAPAQDGFDNDGPVDFEISTGLATFVRKTVSVESWESLFVCGERNSARGDDPTTLPANMLCGRFVHQGKSFVVCNLHGVAYSGTKLDTEQRLEQSRKIRRFLDQEHGAKILCGDFNLMPDTNAMKILEENLENLIEKFQIPRTRSTLTPYHGMPQEQKFADYIFVSSDVRVTNFQVPEIDISDHLPMILEFL